MLTAKDLELVSELLEVGGHFELIRAVAQLKRILDEHREKEEGALATATTAAGASGARLAVYGRHGADITTDSYVSSEEDEDYQTSFVSSLSHLLNPSPSFAQPRARKRQLPKQRKIRGIVATAATPLPETKREEEEETNGFSELKRMFDEIESQQLVCEENGKRRKPKISPVAIAAAPSKAPWPAKKKPRATGGGVGGLI